MMCHLAVQRDTKRSNKTTTSTTLHNNCKMLVSITSSLFKVENNFWAALRPE